LAHAGVVDSNGHDNLKIYVRELDLPIEFPFFMLPSAWRSACSPRLNRTVTQGVASQLLAVALVVIWRDYIDAIDAIDAPAQVLGI
jgi:hypothetical protein